MTDETQAAQESAERQDGESSSNEKSAKPTEDSTTNSEAATAPEQSNEESATSSETSSEDGESTSPPRKKSRRRGRRGGRNRDSKQTEDAESTSDSSSSEEDSSEESGENDPPKKKSRRRTSKKTQQKTSAGENDEAASKDDDESQKSDTQAAEESPEQSEGDDSDSQSRKRSSKKARSSSRPRRPERMAIEVTPVGPMCEPGARTMVVDANYEDECRIAFLENGVLEEIFVERKSTATSVGNIYKGRVVNVEAAIQAAFIDYGQSQNGFLHVSDLHPQYFPGGEKTERVGRKTPRRERPPIQDALKKGQEVLVQVLKQGVGTKGPTLTSYLSIPGRLLVMMPGMDRIGVSRKVEDDEQRRQMRKILDQLTLPEGFGFILRTAGFDRGKTELKRDAAYLQRLWKQIEKRNNSVGAPAELYTEGDLLIRSIRDMVDPSIGEIITNSRDAFTTTSQFLSIVAPRSSPPIRYYDGDIPLFEQYAIEKQIDRIHSREVSLKSGGELVIDQAEALVAIDVNSGRSRAARDSETNAYQTNCEAVDEIARQLRLRDQGGLVICDLIDMRMSKHRKQIEERLAENLRRDRARTTFLPISEFGILEMTRQRMRPSMRSLHFANCTTCKGLGELRSPDSIAADMIRKSEWLLSIDKIRRVELVCASRSASSLLSGFRRRLDDLERNTNKRVDVRISDTISVNDFNVYAYDERNADVEVNRLSRPNQVKPEDLFDVLPETNEDETEVSSESGSRRRRRRRKPAIADATTVALSGGFDLAPEDELENEDQESTPAENSEQSEAEDSAEGGKKRRRRRRRRRGRGGNSEHEDSTESNGLSESPETPSDDLAESDEAMRVHILAKELDLSSKDLLEICRQQLELDLKTHMSSIPADAIDRLRSLIAGTVPAVAEVTTEHSPEGSSEHSDSEGDDDDAPVRKKRRRRRRRRRRRSEDEGNEEGSGDNRSERNSSEAPSASNDSPAPQAESTPAPVETPSAPAVEVETKEPVEKPKPKPRRRSLYGSQRRAVQPGTIDQKDR